MANGLLAQYTPGLTKHSNLLQAAGSQLTTTGFPMYTCPGSTLTSGTLRVSNTSGSAATVDVAIIEWTDALQLATPVGPTTFESYSIGGGSPAVATSHYLVGTWNSTQFQTNEVVTWTNTNVTNPLDGTNNHSAKVAYWDSGNTKLWLYDMSHPAAATSYAAPTDVVVTGATSGATLSLGPSYAGSQAARGNEGRIRYYDGYDGVVHVNNPETENNLKFKYLETLGNPGGLGERKTSLSGAAYVTDMYNNLKLRPWGTTITLVDAVAGTTSTPVTEIVDDNGTEIEVASVLGVRPENYIVKEVSVNDNATLEIPGIVLGQYQTLYVACAAQVQFSLVGFEEANTVTVY